MIKLTYGLTICEGFLGEKGCTPVEWYDTLQEAEAHVDTHKHAEISVYGLATCLTRIGYVPFGIAQGYHYFGIFPHAQELAAANGITDDVILGRVPA